MSCCGKGHLLNKQPLYHHFHCRHKEDSLSSCQSIIQEFFDCHDSKDLLFIISKTEKYSCLYRNVHSEQFPKGEKSINSGIFWWCCRHLDWGIGHDGTVSFWFSASEKGLFNTVMKNRSDYPSQGSKNVPRSPPIEWISFLLHPSFISSLFKVSALQFYLGISPYLKFLLCRNVPENENRLSVIIFLSHFC